MKSGEIYVLGNDKENVLEELKELPKDTSYDKSFKSKLKLYLNLDNQKLINHFYKEFENVVSEIVTSNRQMTFRRYLLNMIIILITQVV